MAGSPTALDVARTYFDALAAKDFGTVAGLFAEEIVWHQPGDHQFSGVRHGSDAVGQMLGGMMTVSEGTFALELTGPLMVNGALVAAPIHFSGKREGASMSQDGVDVLRIDGDRVAEVWLYSSEPAAEDAFWGAG